MLIRRRDPVPNELQWLAEPGSAPLRNLWAGRLYLTQTWQSIPHASAETCLLFMAGAAHVTVKSPRTVSEWYNYDAGVSERTIYDWPRGDLIIIPPAWGIHGVPLADVVDVLILQAWLPEGERGGLPAMVAGKDATVAHHSSTCLSRDYGRAAVRLHIGTTENADGYGSFPYHSDGEVIEEVRMYDVQPEGGEAVQRLKGQYIMGQQVDAAVVVRSGDVCVLPCGDTPILRVPNSAVFYDWAYIKTEDNP